MVWVGARKYLNCKVQDCQPGVGVRLKVVKKKMRVYMYVHNVCNLIFFLHYRHWSANVFANYLWVIIFEFLTWCKVRFNTSELSLFFTPAGSPPAPPGPSNSSIPLSPSTGLYNPVAMFQTVAIANQAWQQNNPEFLSQKQDKLWIPHSGLKWVNLRFTASETAAVAPCMCCTNPVRVLGKCLRSVLSDWRDQSQFPSCIPLFPARA